MTATAGRPSLLKIFGLSVVVTVAGLAAALLYGGPSGLTVADVQSEGVRDFVGKIERSVMFYGTSTGFFGKRMVQGGPGVLSAAVVYGPTLTFQTGGAYDLLDGVVLGDALHVTYTQGRKGVLTAGAVTFADAHTMTATIISIAEDRSTVTVQNSGGQTLTLSPATPHLLDWLEVGDAVSVTYTLGADGAAVARTIQRVP